MSRTEWIEFANTDTRTGMLGVVRRDGSAHVSPVWFLVAADGSEVLLCTGADTVKGRALARDPRFTLCVDDQAPPFSFVQIRAEATLQRCDDSTLPEAIRLAARYMGPELGEQYGRRNNVDSEYLVRGRITRVVALAEIAD